MKENKADKNIPNVLMKSVSGIRGTVGKSLTPDLIFQVATAFAKYTNRGKIVVGRDSRPTGEAISHMLCGVLELSGCEVVELGIVPTPTVQIMVEELKADGGIIISASHNPIEWNAFKLVNKNGSFLNSKEITKFFAMMEEKISYPVFSGIGHCTQNEKASAIHIKKVLSVSNTSKIRKAKFKVVLDSVNGAGSIITQQLLEAFGCEVVPLFCTIDGTFPRVAEPLAENLTDLAKSVIKHKADIGIAQDPDADRLALVDENGRPIGEELTVSLAVDYLLAKESGLVVVNLSTTKTVEDIANRYNAKFYRSKVGEINVVEEMRRLNARIGGEGNGGVISPEVHLGRDSLVGIGYILSLMAEKKKSLSSLVADLPKYFMIKGKVAFKPGQIDDAFFDNLKKVYKTEKISSIDGLRIDFNKHKEFAGGWVHLRASNTEPIFRIITEGKTKEQAEAIYKHFASLIK